MENYKKSITSGHKIIDKVFSTDLAKQYNSDEKRLESHLKKDITVGVLPPPGALKGTPVNINIDKLLKAGKAFDRAGFTKAGRSLMKHGYRKGSVFPKPIGNAAQVNKQGQAILEEILADPKKVIYPNRFGGKDIYQPSGRGMRFDNKDNLMGFLQPRQKK